MSVRWSYLVVPAALLQALGCAGHGSSPQTEEPSDAGLGASMAPVSVTPSAQTRANIAKLRQRFVRRPAIDDTATSLPGVSPATPEPEPVIAEGPAVRFERDEAGFHPVIEDKPTAPVTAKEAEVTLPVRAHQPVQVRDKHSGMSLRFVLDGARDTVAEVADGVVVYEGAGPWGSTIVHRPTFEGTEDYVVFETSPRQEQVRYHVDVAQVRGLRLVANTLEFLDATGTPRLRVAPPYVIDAAGDRHAATLSVEGCSYDTDPRGPWDRPVVAPRAGNCAIEVSWQDVQYPAVLDPSWVTTGSMIEGRAGHTATVLPSGSMLLVTGGITQASPLSTAELFNPASGTWASTSQMAATRFYHTATRLSDGKVLVVGSSQSSSTQAYDQPTGTWQAKGSLGDSRIRHSTTLLTNGTLLVAGGQVSGTPSATVRTSANNGGVWAAAGPMPEARSEHCAVLTPAGQLVLTGGYGASGVVDTAVRYDPSASSWSSEAAMPNVRARHACWASGTAVYVAGGIGNNAPIANVDKLPGAGQSWTALTVMPSARSNAAFVPELKWLIGGMTSSSTVNKTVLRFDEPGWNELPMLQYGRKDLAATLLGDGTVVVTGGYPATGNALPITEVYVPLSNGSACTQPWDCASGFCVDGYCCDTGCEGTCMGCSLDVKLQGSNGFCGPIKPGNDPQDECLNDGTTCGRTGMCNGSGACAYAPLYTSCGSTCTSGTQVNQYCDGAGQCISGGSTACSPYLCNGPVCATSCLGKDSNCVGGYYCASNVCTPKKPMGYACTAPNECVYGFCVDGVCCNDACTGACHQCNGAQPGNCTFVPVGLDPRDACENKPPESCGTSGGCNGSGACKLWEAGLQCGTPSCESSTFKSWTCDGNGGCNQSTLTCTPYTCTTTGCLTSCTGDAQCVDGFYCAGGACVFKKSQGEACLLPNQCSSGFCADGVCCNVACTDICMGCSNALTGGLQGACAAISVGMDPKNQCPDDGSTSCQRTGWCNGMGGCQLYADGSSCGNPTCSGTQVIQQTCMNGACTSNSTSCSPYVCANGVCKTSCTGDSDCISSHFCQAGTCEDKGVPGQACTMNSQCTSGFCVDGFCCNSLCNGLCEACSGSLKGDGVDGQCGPVAFDTDPNNECAQTDPAFCGTTGTCGSNGTCRLFNTATVCDPPICENNAQKIFMCNGTGNCVASTTPCAPFACVDAQCRSYCWANSDCAEGNYCQVQTGQCLPKQLLGTPCSSPAQCVSNFCTDGVCCDGACGGGVSSDCQACNLSGLGGLCKAVGEGTQCRSASLPCDVAEFCDGNNFQCPADGFKNSSTVCRVAVGQCDAPESCPGDGPNCPPDVPKAPGTPCDDDSKVCTTDLCDGFSCKHSPGNAGTLCRQAVNECDVAETCNGSLPDCPTDLVKAVGSPCSDDNNPCSADVCNGVSGNPECTHPAGNGGVQCRPSAGVCDAPENCSGVSTACPPDLKHPSGHECRAPVGACDVAETCTGSGNQCPQDVFRPNSFQCRTASCLGDIATLPANCSGSSANCPPESTQSCAPSTCNGAVCGGCTDDTQCSTSQFCNSGVCVTKKSNGQLCSGTNQCTTGFCVDGVCCNTACDAGLCDSCNNTNLVGTCSAVPSSTVCRPAADECDLAETCGGQMTCPSDAKKPVNTACADDGNPCTKDVCDGSSAACTHPAGNPGLQCRPANASPCDVADYCDGVSTSCVDAKQPGSHVCRAASGDCDVAESCTGTADACPPDGKKAAGTQCADDNNLCTTDACDSSGNCVHPPGNAGTQCREANGACDVADTCTGSSPICPDNKRPSSHVCRVAADVCDEPDTCDGSSDTCPADLKKPSGTACQDDGLPCSQDICNGVSNVCQHPAGWPGLTCRAAAGPCDVADTCNGSSTMCVDMKKAAGSACRAAAGSCDLEETCDGLSNACPIDEFKPSLVECRTASCTASVATLAANCTGSSAQCPPLQTQDCAPTTCAGTQCGGCFTDNDCVGTMYCSGGVCKDKKAIGVACGGANQCLSSFCADNVCCNTACNGGVCDACNLQNLVGTCSPVSFDTVCRPAATECDVAETCGGAMVCPSDATKHGQPCSNDSNPCTADVCNGATCTHDAAPASTVCRPAAGECDLPETCGGATSCPADLFKPDDTACPSDENACTVDVCKAGACEHNPGNAGTICRGSAGECDAAEACDGSSPSCPVDSAKADNTPCSSDNKPCTSDVCLSGVCSHPAGNAGTVCRQATGGECDAEETCDGLSPNCPADGFKPDGQACTDDGLLCSVDQCLAGFCAHIGGNAGTQCRAAAGECDAAESCDGLSVNCPADLYKPAGTPCSEDGNLCTADQCLQGACSHPSKDGTDCDDANVCTTNDSCSASQCVGTPVPGCACQGPADCNDNNACNGVESCSSGVCVPGTALNCDDNSPCTDDGCEPANGCTHVSVPDGATCNDGKYCKVADECQAGVCIGTADRDCSSVATGQCTVGVCDEPSKSCIAQQVPDQTACDDDDACTGPDQCLAGQCKGAAMSGCKACEAVQDCDDLDPCTTDLCDDAAKSCTWVPIDNCGLDGGTEGGAEAGPDAQPDVVTDVVVVDATDAAQDKDAADAADAKPDQLVADAPFADAKDTGAATQDSSPDQGAAGGAGSGGAAADETFSREAPGCACRAGAADSSSTPLGAAAAALLLALALRRRARGGRRQEERTTL